MHPRLLFSLALTALLGFTACDKDKEAGCEQLAAAVRDNDEDAARRLMSDLLLHLPDRPHTADNLQKLVATINKQCKVTATVGCFECIKTLPATSEITVKSGDQVRTLDITANAAGNMVYSNMH